MATRELRFLCDEMLAGLGRWLRVAGYDTAIAERGCPDRDLVAQACREERILLTRDRRLVEIRRARDRTLVLAADGIDTCAAELSRRLTLDWTRSPLSRCTLCNTKLQLADRRMQARLPPGVGQSGAPVTVCPTCGRLYWEGSHVRRIRQRLESFARRGGEADSVTPLRAPAG